MATHSRTILLLTFISITLIYGYHKFYTASPEFSTAVRRLSIDNDNYIDSLNDFPPLLFTYKQLQNWAWIFYFCGMMYCFVGIAIVCDDYFVPAVEVIAERLDMSEDTAGATWLAIGTSAPELFTAFVGTFVAKSDVGFGTIVGSAVFNLLLIIGACAIFTAGDLKLKPWSFARDMTYFLLCLCVLAIFYGGISKNQFYWWECVIMLLLYVLYVCLMKYNERLKVWFYKQFILTGAQKQLLVSGSQQKKKKGAEIEISERDKSVQQKSNVEMSESVHISTYGTSDQEYDDTSRTGTRRKRKSTIKGAGGDYFIRELPDDAEGGLDFSFPDGLFNRISYIIQAPLTFLIYFTCFDVTKESNMDWYPWTFVVALLWLGGLSYLMVWWAVCVGYAWYVPQEIMGLVFLAFGTSVPELFACVIVAKKGKADMAIAGSIGSNIFDVLVGLPLPWLSFALYQGGSEIKIDTTAEGLFMSIIVLIIMMILITILIIFNKWILTHCTGWTMVALYFVFVLQDILRYYLWPVRIM